MKRWKDETPLRRRRQRRRRRGQAILEYILMTVMVAVIVAVAIRSSTQTVYEFWTGLARVVALPCPECVGNQPPTLP